MKKPILIAIILVILASISGAVYYFFVYKKPKEFSLPTRVSQKPQEVTEKASAPPTSEKAVPKEEEKVPAVGTVGLDESDGLVRKLGQKLCSHPQWAVWLGNKDLIRRVTAVIDNIAHGVSPRPHMPFLAPSGKFQVIEKKGLVYLNPASYKRYNLIADVFDSLDAKGCAKIYHQLSPLFQKAYQELGYPDQDFQDTLFKAITELLKTPVVKGDILLKKKVITYQMVDPYLENLHPAQKHLIRMGPENTIKIQRKLREIALALGMPEQQIPQPQIYYPENE